MEISDNRDADQFGSTGGFSWQNDVDYEYDNNGNTTKITTQVNDSVEVAESTLYYDSLNRLTSHVTPKGTETFTYRGDAWHRKSMTASGTTTNFLYDGDNVVADYTGTAPSRSAPHPAKGGVK